MAHHGFRGLGATRLSLGLLLLAAATLAQSPISAATMVTLGSAEARAGQTVTVPITLAAGATASGLDITVSVTASPGAPAVSSPVFALGAQAADWSIFSTGNPWRYVAYKIPGIDGPAELLRLSVTLDPSTPVGATYTLSASSVDLTHKDGLPEYTDTSIVQPGQITVSNHPPTATPASVSTTEDTAKAITLAGVDSDGDTLSYSLASQPAHGTLSGTAPGLTYTPAPNYNGPDAFTFTVSDGVATSAPATVSITVTAVNDPPIATSQSVTTAEDTPKALTLAGTDIDGDPLSYAVASQPAHGTLSGAAPNLTYTPSANYNGADSFSFTASDGTATSSPATVSISISPVNDPPVLTVPGTRSASEGQALSFTVSATDADGDAVTLSATGLPNGATFTASTGTLNWTPGPGQAGTYTVTFGASDGHGGTDSETVRIDVAHVNRAPSATPATVSTAEDTAKPITLAGSDPDGDTLTYTVSTQPAHGMLSGSAPYLTYTPAANYNGADGFSFTVSDGALTSAPATVNITVTAVNDPPLATPQSVTTAEDTAKGVTLSGTDPDGDPLTYSVTAQPSHGSLGGVAPNLTYTPAANYNGADSFSFTVSDGKATSAPATVSVTVTPVNDPPVLTVPAAQSVAEGQPLSFTVGATDADGDTVTLSASGLPSGASFTPSSGAFSWTPGYGQSGGYTVTFSASDGHGGTDSKSVGINVTDVNRAPTATPQSLSTAEDTARAITLSGTDPDGDTLSFSVVGQPSHGTLSGTAPNLTYAPAANYNGADSFSFTVSDGKATSTAATISLTITAVNDPPVLTVPGGQSVNEGQPLTFSVSATDLDGDSVTLSASGLPSGATFTPATGSFSWTPGYTQSGTYTVTFTANDGHGGTDSESVRLDVSQVNRAPSATPLSVSAVEDTPKTLTLQGSDPDGDALTYSVLTQPAHGALSGTAPSLTYTPAANYNGPDSFTYSVSDGKLASAPATVSLTVAAVNDPPTATAQSVTTAEDTAKPITLSGTDPDGDSLTYVVVAPPTHGTLGGTAPNLTYTPAANYNGPDSFSFSVRDAAQATSQAAVTITVTPVNDAPVLTVPGTQTGSEGQTLSFTVSATDLDGDALTLSASGLPTGASFTPATGVFSWTPSFSQAGSYTLTFSASDGKGGTDSKSVRVDVTGVNQAPSATAQSLTTPEDTAKAITLVGTDPDSDPLTYTVTTQPAHGTLSGTAPNLTYTPAKDYNGSDSFSFSVTDGKLSSSPATVSLTVTPVNDAPVAVADSASLRMDTSVEVSPLANDSDPDGDPLSLSGFTQPAHGAVSQVRTGVLRYTPTAGYLGTDSFRYTVSDGQGGTAQGTVSLTLLNNAPPVAAAQSLSTPEETPKSLTLSATDPEGDPISYSLVTPPAHGTLTGTPPSLTYTPAQNYNGPDSFSFKANDGHSDSQPAVISLTVTPVNDPPTATPQSATTAEDTAKPITLAGTDPDGDPLTFSVTAPPTHGTLSGTAPNLTYTPAPNYNGSDGFSFTVSDGKLASSPALVSLTVTPVNDAPVLTVPGAQSGVEGSPLSFRVTATDADGDAVTLNASGLPSGATFTPATGAFAWTPSFGQSGSVTVSFTANDGHGGVDTESVRIDIGNTNRPPTAQPQSLTTPQEAPLPLTLSGSDPDGDRLTYTVVTQPAHGTLTGTAPNLTYTGASRYSGSDSFAFRVNDGKADSASATVSLTITKVNHAPTADSRTVSTAEDTAVAVPLSGSDPDGDPLTFTVIGQPAHGSLNGTGSSRTYTPAANYNGPDSFTYKASDGQMESALATVTLTVTPVNDAPVLTVPGTQTGSEGQTLSFTVSATDLDGDALTLSASGLPTGASFASATGVFSWTPSFSQAGSYTLTFSASDGKGGSDSKSVRVDVTGVNQAPSATAQSLTTPEDTAKAITLVGTDPDGDPLTYTVTAQPSHGTLSGTAPNLTYTPAKDYNGSDGFSFSVSDGKLSSSPATVSLTVTPVNDAPLAVADSASLRMDTSVEVSPLANDSDPDGDPLSLSAFTQPAHGAISQVRTGVLRYTPTAGYLGTDSFRYTVSDGQGGTAQGTVSLTLLNNAPPVAAPQSLSTPEETPKSLTLSATDPEGDPISYSLVTPPAHGTLTGTPPSLTYTPAQNYNGPDSFSFKANDGHSDSQPAVISLTVTPVNDPPTATPQSATTAEDTAKPITLAGSDPDGDSLTFSVTAPPAHGTLSGTAPNLTYTPAPNYNGSDGFSFTVSDGKLVSSPALVSLTVTPVNDAPVLTVPGAQSGAEGSPLSFRVTATDADGDAVTLSAGGLPSGATFTPATGAFAWTPSFGQSGSVMVSFTANDGHGGVDTESVRIDVSRTNRPPQLTVPGAQTGQKGQPLTFTVSATDPDSDTVTLAATGLPSGATFAPSTGAFAWTPGDGQTGTFTVSFTASDGRGGTDAKSVRIDVAVVNRPPTATPQSVSLASGTSRAITLTGTDPDGDALTYTVVTQPGHGKLTGTAPNVSYTADAGFDGPDTFTFRVSDGRADSDVAPVSLTVTSANRPPTAVDDTLTAKVGVAAQVNVLANDTDPDGDALTVTAITQPGHGTAMLGSGGTVTYTPAAGYTGPDSLTYTLSDGEGGTDTGIVTLTVVTGNRPPVAKDDSASTAPGQAVLIPVLANDTDPDGDTLAVASVTQASKGAATVSGTQVRYAPLVGAAGQDTFSYTVSDGHGGTATATVTVAIVAQNHPPVLTLPADQTVAEAAPLSFRVTATDADADVPTLSAEPLPQGASFTSETGVFTWTPLVGQAGTYIVSFTASDGKGGSDTKSLTLTVTPVGHDLAANADAKVVDEEIAKTFPVADLLANDSGPLGLTLSVVSVTPTADTHGTVKLAYGKVTYTPEKDFNGPASFNYTISDGAGGTATGLVRVTVRPINDAPVAQDLSASTLVGRSVELTLKGSDAEGSALTFSIARQPNHGTLGAIFGAKVTYTPQAGYIGPDSFTFRVSDGDLTSDPAVVDVVVGNPPLVGGISLQSKSVRPGQVAEVALTAEGLDSLLGLSFTVESWRTDTLGLFEVVAGDRMAGAEVSLKLHDGVANVTLSVPTPGPATGTVALLRFRIPDILPEGASYPLNLSAARATLADPSAGTRDVLPAREGATLTMQKALLRGDPTGDRTTDVRDVLVTLRIMLGLLTPTADQLYGADINGDGKVNITDVLLMLRATLGLPI